MVPATLSPQTCTPPRTDATARLLLLLAREHLNCEQRERATALLPQVTNWSELLTFAAHNKSLGFVQQHLAALGGKVVPVPLLAEARHVARRMAMDQMAVNAAMRRFQRTCIAPFSARHVFFKGPALAVQFYRQPALRPCSDIDILVSERDYAKVTRAALQRGDRFLFPSEPPAFATDPNDIDFMIRRNDVIMSFDASNVLFEIHRHIEKTTPIFPEQELLRTAQKIRLGATEVATLSTAWHFVYICYHHSRHFWSRLHWVADLHALLAHASFDAAKAIALAKSVGLAPTVEAAIAFAALTDKPEEWPNVLGATPAGVFLDACLRGLPGDSAYEKEGWKDMFLFDFGNPWQYDPSRKYWLWARSALRRLHPNCHQYAKQRRPKALEWVYFLENIATLSGNAFQRMAKR